MNREKNKWIDDVLSSHQGKVRQKPAQNLFDSISMNTQSTKKMNLRQMAIAGIAASVLLFVNIAAIQSHNTSTASVSHDIAYGDQFISDYNLYDYE